MSEHRVARVDDVPTDRGLPVTVEGRAVALFRIGADVHAVGGRCPHQFADLADGWIEDGYVVCSNHMWCFSLVDGSMPTNDVISLPVFSARVVEGWVHVSIDP